MCKVQSRHSCQTCTGSGRVRILHQGDEGGYWQIAHCEDCQGTGFVVVVTYRTDDSGLTASKG